MSTFVSIFGNIINDLVLPFFALQIEVGDISFSVGSIFAWIIFGGILLKFLHILGGYFYE